VRTSSQNIGNIQVSQTISNAALEELEKRCTRVSGLAAYSIAPRLNVGFSGRSELASGHFVWGSYQSVLGVQSLLAGASCRRQSTRRTAWR